MMTETTYKTRKITIHKPKVYADIDVATFKYMDAGEGASPRRENAIASDSLESLDRSIVVSLVDYRDAMLRRSLQTCLADEDVESADDIQDNEEYYFYMFRLPEGFRDSQLKPMAIFIHRYLVLGALHDWYLRIGSAQAQAYSSQLEEMECEIVSAFRSPSVAKRPLQPFGPAGRTKGPLNF